VHVELILSNVTILRTLIDWDDCSGRDFSGKLDGRGRSCSRLPMSSRRRKTHVKVVQKAQSKIEGIQ
jgi:hypothetical protein